MHAANGAELVLNLKLLICLMSHDCFYFSISVSIAEQANAGVSRSKSVLHNKATVKKEPLQKVVGSDKYRTRNDLENLLPIPHVLQTAESLVGKVLPYNLSTCNCEHFATELRCGKPQSLQVQLFGMTIYIRIILYS